MMPFTRLSPTEGGHVTSANLLGYAEAILVLVKLNVSALIPIMVLTIYEVPIPIPAYFSHILALSTGPIAAGNG